MFFALTFRESALIHHRAPGARQLVNMKANGKLILGIGFKISHKKALLIPVDERIKNKKRSLKGQFTKNTFPYGQLNICCVFYTNEMYLKAFDT